MEAPPVSQKPKVILLIETSHSYGRGLLRGIAKYSRNHGPWDFYKPEPFYRSTTSNMKTFITSLKECGANGIILRELPEKNTLRELGLPAVVSPYSTLRLPGFPNIIADNIAIGKMGAEHLLELGFKHFAFCGFPDLAWSEKRAEGFSSRIQDAGYKTERYELPKAASHHAWAKEQYILADWLRAIGKPVGLMTCTDDRSYNVAQACKHAGLHVPEQVAIVGVDNDSMICELSAPPLSSIALNTQKTGYEAARVLDALMKGSSVSEEVIPVDPLYVVGRLSTDIFTAEDPDVTHALRFIRENVRKPISVDDIVSVSRLSRRSLELHFRKSLGRSIYEEISQARNKLIIQMLMETNLTISEIAHSMGYSNIEHISRTFRRLMGISPLAYRKKSRY